MSKTKGELGDTVKGDSYLRWRQKGGKEEAAKTRLRKKSVYRNIAQAN